jgi:hypothetical protein
MDPNAALEGIRGIYRRVIHDGAMRDDAEELASRIAALDEWLTRGGFPPSAWPIQRHALRETLEPVSTCLTGHAGESAQKLAEATVTEVEPTQSRCPYCETFVSVRDNGRLHAHGLPSNPCDGSGYQAL